MKLLFLDLETTNLLEQLDHPKDIIIQLAFITIDTETNEKNVYDVRCNPGTEINFGCMSTHHITPEMLEGLPSVKETDEYRILKEIIESNEYVFFAHNAKFDIGVLKMVDINIEEGCQIVDTLTLAEIINDHKGLPLEMNRLGYLFYALGLYKKLDEIREEFGVVGTNMYHEAVTDILYLILYVRHLIENEGLEIKTMIELCKNPIALKYIPFGKNRGEKFESLSYNQLKWYATLDNENVSYTAGLYL